MKVFKILVSAVEIKTWVEILTGNKISAKKIITSIANIYFRTKVGNNVILTSTKQNCNVGWV